MKETLYQIMDRSQDGDIYEAVKTFVDGLRCDLCKSFQPFALDKRGECVANGMEYPHANDFCSLFEAR